MTSMTAQTQQNRSRLLLKALLFAVMAIVVTAVTGGVWTALLNVNLATSPAIPWSVAVMAVLLWLLWRYLGGAGWPRSTADARRRYLRARRISGRVFAWAVVAGLLSIVALAGLWVVLFQIANLPSRALPDYSKYPLVTVALALVMASLVGAVAEESTFRGYTQGVLEGAVGGVAAILITTLVMAPEHAFTQGFVWPVLLFYFLVDVMLGATALLTQSISARHRDARHRAAGILHSCVARRRAPLTPREWRRKHLVLDSRRADACLCGSGDSRLHSTGAGNQATSRHIDADRHRCFFRRDSQASSAATSAAQPHESVTPAPPCP